MILCHVSGAFSGSVIKKPLVNARDVGDTSLVPGSGRSPGEGNGNPLQFSSLENPMNRGVWQATSMGSQKVRQSWAHTHMTCLIQYKRLTICYQFSCLFFCANLLYTLLLHVINSIPHYYYAKQLSIFYWYLNNNKILKIYLCSYYLHYPSFICAGQYSVVIFSVLVFLYHFM